VNGPRPEGFCIHCGAMLASGGRCPVCTRKPKIPPMPVHVRALIAVSAGIAIIFVLGALLREPVPLDRPLAAETSANRPAISITAASPREYTGSMLLAYSRSDERGLIHIPALILDREFRANELAAKRTYGKAFVAACTVESINENAWGDPWVGCVADNEFMPVHFDFPKEWADELALLQKRQTIWSVCRDAQLFAGSVMADCSQFRYPKAARAQ